MAAYSLSFNEKADLLYQQILSMYKQASISLDEYFKEKVPINIANAYSNFDKHLSTAKAEAAKNGTSLTIDADVYRQFIEAVQKSFDDTDLKEFDFDPTEQLASLKIEMIKLNGDYQQKQKEARRPSVTHAADNAKQLKLHAEKKGFDHWLELMTKSFKSLDKALAEVVAHDRGMNIWGMAEWSEKFIKSAEEICRLMEQAQSGQAFIDPDLNKSLSATILNCANLLSERVITIEKLRRADVKEATGPTQERYKAGHAKLFEVLSRLENIVNIENSKKQSPLKSTM